MYNNTITRCSTYVCTCPVHSRARLKDELHNISKNFVFKILVSCMKDGTVFLVLQIRISHNELSNHAFANYAYQKYKPMVYL